jgi:hypothetical protein
MLTSCGTFYLEIFGKNILPRIPEKVWWHYATLLKSDEVRYSAPCKYRLPAPVL